MKHHLLPLFPRLDFTPSLPPLLTRVVRSGEGNGGLWSTLMVPLHPTFLLTLLPCSRMGPPWATVPSGNFHLTWCGVLYRLQGDTCSSSSSPPSSLSSTSPRQPSTAFDSEILLHLNMREHSYIMQGYW